MMKRFHDGIHQMVVGPKVYPDEEGNSCLVVVGQLLPLATTNQLHHSQNRLHSVLLAPHYSATVAAQHAVRVASSKQTC